MRFDDVCNVAFGLKGKTYLGNGKWEPKTAPDSWSDLEPLPSANPHWLEVPHCTSGDYGGDGAVAVANRRDLLPMLRAADPQGRLWAEVSGSHGSESIMLADVEWPDTDEVSELHAVIAALSEYSAMDEQTLSEVEAERQDEAWESWVAEAFLRAAIDHIPGDRDDIEDTIRPSLREIFEKCVESADVYWTDEYGGAWIDVRRAAEHAEKFVVR